MLQWRSGQADIAWQLMETSSQIIGMTCVWVNEACGQPEEVPGLQAWAVLEWKQGQVDTARQLLETGSRADPHHLHIWQAWGVLEHREGNPARAREMFQQAVWAQPKGKEVAIVWQVCTLACLCPLC